MTELFIPRQGRNLSPPLQGLPRLRPGESVRCVSVDSSATRQGIDAATGPVAVVSSGHLAPAGPGEPPAGPGTSRVRRGGPRHGRRTNLGRTASAAVAAPMLAGTAGLVLGLCLGVAGWALCAQEPKDPGLTQREIAVALREARLVQLQQRFAGPEAAVAGRPASTRP